MVVFLAADSGLIAAHAIVRISALNTRPTGNFHEIEYRVGREPRETRAGEEAVRRFMELCGHVA